MLSLLASGCTPWREYVRNGFKVGPNYVRPPAPVAPKWIDSGDARVHEDPQDVVRWWKLFNDPVLDELICTAYRQNLTLRQAGARVLQARYQLAIDVGNLFPQQQQAVGSYERLAISKQTSSAGALSTQPQFFNQWNAGFNLAWEVDFGGRYRRAIEADQAVLDEQVFNYDAALVTLLGDIASTYAQMHTLEQRIRNAEQNVAIQRSTLEIVQARFRAQTISELDVDQAETTLAATQAAIVELRISLRQTMVQLCILMGMPPEDLYARIGQGSIPVAPRDVVVGLPADLLRRRPDVRAAERQIAAQSATIGVAESLLYPHFTINGTLGWASRDVSHLFEPRALNSNIIPTVTWNVLNFGRLINNVRLQDARLQELVAHYQQTVLSANQEVENGLVTFLRGRERTELQLRAVQQARRAVTIALRQYQAGSTDFTTVTQVLQVQVQQQDLLAQAQGEIASGLIQVYRSLGGGWQIKCEGCNEALPLPSTSTPPAETISTPPAGEQPSPLPPLNSQGELHQPDSLQSTFGN
jgi:NodT family efflux transporter outer membrane factor (OMF) lipoprotein